jgi:hypothetical protein
MAGSLTQTIYVKYTFTDKESLDLSRKMARAEAAINEKMDELKSVSTTIKADIAVQEGILHSCAEKLRSGYEMRPREAELKYEKGVVKFIDKETGEVLEERPMTQDEQLGLTSKRTDAETIIRQARQEEKD